MRRYAVIAPLLLVAAPASAQFWGGPSGGAASGGMPSSVRATVKAQTYGETRKIRSDIDDGRDAGQLTRKDARRLRREAYQIDSMESRFGRDGLSDAEAAQLAVRRQLLRDDVIAKRSGQRK